MLRLSTHSTRRSSRKPVAVILMCGRYGRTTSDEEFARRYRIPISPQLDLPISYDIAPAQDVLAIRFKPETKQRSLEALRWGSNAASAKRSENRVQDDLRPCGDSRYRDVIPAACVAHFQYASEIPRLGPIEEQIGFGRIGILAVVPL